MRLSAKTKYGLSALISMAANASAGESVTVVSLAKKLDISKIYLEQVFSLLKRAGLVTSIKGAQGGYQLSRDPKDITVYEILSAIETAMFEKTKISELEPDDAIGMTILKNVFNPIDDCLKQTLTRIALGELAAEARDRLEGYMYYL
ncbi:MAG: Rrf2 family transcriptional regulator [Clostridiales bacterium]|jgi:Rrf2 family protein|nr:Rrf2 family transcriptional regulator [Clostridiales bacterium]